MNQGVSVSVVLVIIKEWGNRRLPKTQLGYHVMIVPISRYCRLTVSKSYSAIVLGM